MRSFCALGARVVRKIIGRREVVRRRRIACILLIVLLLLGVLLVKLDTDLRPLVQSYGLQAARRSAMLAVHSGVEEVLARQDVGYDELVSVYRSAEGTVLSAEANVATINLLKSQVTDAVTQRLNDSEKQQIGIPLGNLIGGSFFTGRGPFLPLTIHTSGSVITTLTSQFSDAGINQTCHSIYMNMTVVMTVLLPLEQKSLELETEFLISETVLVGEVPDAYTNMNFGENEALSKIFGVND